MQNFVINKFFNLRRLAGGFICGVKETSLTLETTNENNTLHMANKPPAAVWATSSWKLSVLLQVFLGFNMKVFFFLK